MTDEHTTTRRKSDIHVSQLVATALAAITAAFLGSRLGIAGTISGAGLASMISTLAGALYQRSLDRTTRTVRTVRSKVGRVRNGNVADPATPDTASSDTAVADTTSSGTAVATRTSGVLSVSGSLADPVAPSTVRTLDRDVSRGDPNAPTRFLRPERRPGLPGGAGSADGAGPTVQLTPARQPGGTVAPPVPARRRLTWRMAVGLTVGAFLIGMAAVTGFELLHHGPISGGDNGTTVGSLFGQSTERATTPGAPTTSTRPTGSPATTGQESASTSTTTAPPTTTTTPPPGQSQTQGTTTTTEPPTTTTTTTAPTTTTTDVAP
jgi:hypothetical protein